jgi:DNA-binding NarL/FixJ family response regulator
MIRIILADDHQIVLDGLKMLLQEEPHIQLVGEAINGKQVLNLLEREAVDIAVLDVEMPVMNGIEASEIIREKYPDTKILILTMYNDQAFIRKLIEIGASGYILKNKGKEELAEAIKDISEGKTYFGREVTNTLISGIQTVVKNKPAEEIPLTKREIDVVKLIADGKSTPQIAEELFIAHSTVETHRRNLIDKTGVPNSKALIKWAIQHGYSE